MAYLKERYQKEGMSELQQKFGYKSVMAVPRIEKVVMNTSYGKLVANKQGDELKKTREAILEDLKTISGQKAALTPARKSIAGFGLREGMPIGAKVTLRGSRMYDFLERLLNVVLPRSRDFRGISVSAVDKKGNLSIGIREHIFFPEISPEQVRNIFGLEITVVTTAQTHEEGVELFKQLGFPFKHET